YQVGKGGLPPPSLKAINSFAAGPCLATRWDLHYFRMVTITFPDRETEKRALAFLLGRFSGRILRSGEHIVPEAALEALADQEIPFNVKGKASLSHPD